MVLGYTGMISVNLAIMNLLPIPALDGGRALLIGLEKAIGRSIVSRYEVALNYFSILVLSFLFALVSLRDVWRWWQG